MPQIDRDWMVSELGWNTQDGASQANLPSNSQTAMVLGAANLAGAGLPNATEVFNASDDFVSTAVRGEILVQWDAKFGTTWEMMLEMRIEVLDLSPDTNTPILPLGYSLTNNVGANRAWMWHHTHYMRRLGSWTEPSQSDPSSINVPVNIKTSRRVQSTMGVCLVLEYTGVGAASVGPTINYTTRLRVLGQK